MGFLEEHLGINTIAELLGASASFIAIVTAIVAVVVWHARRMKEKKPATKLRVIECRATLRIHHSSGRSNDAEALIANDGEAVCYVNNMRLLSDVFDLETVRISFDHGVASATTGRGNEAPLRLNAGEMKRVYIRTQELIDEYSEQLPNSVQVSIIFDSEPVTVCLARDGDRSVYMFKNDIDQ